MAEGNPNFGNQLTSTFEDVATDLADNYTINMGLLEELNKAGNINTCEGGDVIGQDLEISNSGAYVRYTGMKEWELQQNKFLTKAQYSWKQVACPVVFSGLEIEVKNQGGARRHDLMKTKIKNARKTFKNGMSEDIYSDGSLVDQIGGLDYLVSATPSSGVVGGIDRANADNAFWRNEYATSAYTSATIEAGMEDMFLRLCRNADKPNLIVADNVMYKLFWESQEGKRRYASTERKAGATELMFNDIPIIADGGKNGEAPTNHMYFLNLDYLYLRPSAKRNVVPIGKRVSLNQDAYVDGIMWAGNMTTSNGGLQGLIVKS